MRPRSGYDRCLASRQAFSHDARRIKHFTRLVEDATENRLSVTQHIDFKAGATKPIASVVNGLAEMAYETKREQSMAGLAAARASGRVGGRPKVAADDADVLEAKKLHKDGKLTSGDICKRLKISRSTYNRYVGK